ASEATRSDGTGACEPEVGIRAVPAVSLVEDHETVAMACGPGANRSPILRRILTAKHERQLPRCRSRYIECTRGASAATTQGCLCRTLRDPTAKRVGFRR